MHFMVHEVWARYGILISFWLSRNIHIELIFEYWIRIMQSIYCAFKVWCIEECLKKFFLLEVYAIKHMSSILFSGSIIFIKHQIDHKSKGISLSCTLFGLTEIRFPFHVYFNPYCLWCCQYWYISMIKFLFEIRILFWCIYSDQKFLNLDV